jgi:ubiquinone/menaquinone biosynthesis C-methylase UbiE
MSIPSTLLAILRDPIDLKSLELQGEQLVNPASRRRYAIVDSIPVLLDSADLGPQNLKIQNMYRWMATGFDLADRIGNFLTNNSIIKLRRQLAGGLPLEPGTRCLYTSIGTGLDLPYLAEHVPLQEIELIGLDLSMEMLGKCRKRIRPYLNSSLLVQGNAERLPFADGVFDVVFHVGGINLFDRPAQAVREMARVAKPGAFVLFADETKEIVKEHYQKKNPFTRGACRDMATDFDPRSWVPDSIANFTYQPVWGGKGYFLSFRNNGRCRIAESRIVS